MAGAEGISKTEAPKDTAGGPPGIVRPTETTVSEPTSSAIAKWLIPSVAALFVAVGYVIQLASRDLLGADYGGTDAQNYIASAAVFFRDLTIIAADQTFGLTPFGERFALNNHGTELTIAVLLVICAFLLPARLATRARLFASLIAPTILVLLVAGKFALLDAPITRIDNVIVGVGIDSENKDAIHGQSIDKRLELAGDGGYLQRLIANRALAIWKNMVCSRMSSDALALAKGRKPEEVCIGQGQKISHSNLTGEFVAQSIANVLLIILAAVLMRSRSLTVHVLAILALAYTLMWPYAYGKLMKSTNFEYGLVQLASPLVEHENETVTTDRSGKGASANDAAVYAVVLSRSEGGADLLVVKSGPCSDESTYREVKLWAVSKS